MITVNKALIQNAGKNNIHFNVPKLENVIKYESDDKDAVKIWKHINSITEFSKDFFPENLENFLFDKEKKIPKEIEKINIEDISF